MSFPIHRVNERELGADWAGEVFVCDIDRTYLATRFSSLRAMARIPVEFAVDKQDIAGMVSLLKEVRRGPGPESRHTPLYFLSASPAQLRPVIERKMLLDGVEFDGTTFKDWRKVLLSGRVRRFREQVGFKLTALLAGRRELPVGAREVLIGDDLESDALIFALYADLLARRLPRARAASVLEGQGVAAGDARAIVAVLEDIPEIDGVRRAYIRLERHRDPEVFAEWAPHVVACRGAFQMAVSLWDAGSIAASAVSRVATSLLSAGETPDGLAKEVADCVQRAMIPVERGEEIGRQLSARGLSLPAIANAAVNPRWRAITARATWTPTRFLCGAV